jgi:hypothetical protein
MKKYRAVVVELFEKGVEHSCNKMSPAQMREEIEQRHPGFYCYPPESKITKCVSALYDAQKKANKGKKTKKMKHLPEEVGLKIREFMAQHTSEKGAAIADRVAEFFGGADRIPGSSTWGRDLEPALKVAKPGQNDQTELLRPARIIPSASQIH